MQLISGQRMIIVPKMESEAYDLEGNNMWFKQGKFPINLHGETEGELMDGNGIKVTTLMDTVVQSQF